MLGWPMNILAIDTAASLCAVCVYDAQAGRELARVVNDIGTGHAERLVNDIEAALGLAGIAYGQLGRIAVSTGPGSFTGVRVGIATARGLALALKVPAVGITTLEALATEARAGFPGRPVLVAIDARRDELYVELYSADGTVAATAAVRTLPETAELARSDDPVLAGSAAPLVLGAAGRKLDIAGDAASADIATFARLAATRPADAERPRAAYLRNPDAKVQAGFILPRSGD